MVGYSRMMGADDVVALQRSAENSPTLLSLPIMGRRKDGHLESKLGITCSHFSQHGSLLIAYQNRNVPVARGAEQVTNVKQVSKFGVYTSVVEHAFDVRHGGFDCLLEAVHSLQYQRRTFRLIQSKFITQPHHLTHIALWSSSRHSLL